MIKYSLDTGLLFLSLWEIFIVCTSCSWEKRTSQHQKKKKKKKNFSQFAVIHTVKGFSEINETEVDVFLKFSCFFYDPVDFGNLISGSSDFSKLSLYTWKFSGHVLCKPSLKDFEHNLATMRNECNCMVVWTFFGNVFLWECNENWPFLVTGHWWVFWIC